MFPTVDSNTRSAAAGPFSPEDIALFEEDGFVLLRGAVPKSLVEMLVQEIVGYIETTRMNGSHDEGPNGVVHMYHHPLQWEIRQHPAIHGAFAQLLRDEQLWVSIDRAKMLRPVGIGTGGESFIHWDINTLKVPDPMPLQGLVALTDTAPGQGGFQCVRGFIRSFQTWVATQPSNRNPYIPNLNGLEVTEVPMEAGDLVIWNALLPHGNSRNMSNGTRVAQFIRMYPAALYGESVRLRRIAMWHRRLPADPQSKTAITWQAPSLTELGRRLLGLSPWPK
jgi:hypothetical protein